MSGQMVGEDLDARVMDRADARAITDQIKVGVEAVWQLITQAYTQRAWSALGYQSWDDYCTREFGTTRLRLPREERAEVVASLRQSGLSIRAIASATQVDARTVRRDMEVGRNAPPEPVADEDALAEELIAAGGPAIPKPITGLDGKRYPPKPPPPQPVPKPPRKPPTYLDEFSRAVHDLGRLVERFARLLADDRYAEHRADLNRAWFPDLVRLFQDALTDFEPLVPAPYDDPVTYADVHT